MKLSELVKCLAMLDQIDLGLQCRHTVERFQGIELWLDQFELPMQSVLLDFKKETTDIFAHLATVQKHYDTIKHEIRKKCVELEPEYYKWSQELYDGEKRMYSNEYLLNRRLGTDGDPHNIRYVNDQSRQLLHDRLLSQSDWRLPGMVIHPANERFIESLVALDPLYIVDQHMDLLQPAMELFPPAYQRRLRPYVINDYEHQDVLWQLPTNQFGFVFAYNFFNYKPMKVLGWYLESIYKKLRPGGIVLFTYNDCDHAHGIALAEVGAATYTPAREIKKHALSLGYEILNNYHGQADVSWLELRKPGEITSIRGGQALAKIVAP